MSRKVFHLVAIIVLGIIVFQVVMQQSSAAPSNEVEVLPESEFPAGSGMNQGDVPVTRVVYVTATPQPTVVPTGESSVSETEPEPLAVIERSPDVTTAADMQPTFQLVFNRVIGEFNMQPYLTVEPAVEFTTHWEAGHILLIRPSAPLSGETTYTFTIAESLTSIDGSKLARKYEWTYKTDGLVERMDHDVLGDGRETISFEFNYPLDPASLNWTILPEAAGDLVWGNDNKMLTFTSHDILIAGARFTIELGDSLRQLNGMPVPEPNSLSFYTDDLTGNKVPAAGSSDNLPIITLEIPFRRTMDRQRVENGLTISPAPSKAPVFSWEGDTMLADVSLSPDTYYTVEVSEDNLANPQGTQTSNVAVKWSFRTKEMDRIAGFGNGPKLQTLQVTKGSERPTVEYAFFRNQEPMPVTFELYELALADWQASPILADYQLLSERPLATWEEPAPVFEEDRYYYSHQSAIPEGIGPGFYRLEMKAFGQPLDVLAILITDVALAFRVDDGGNMLAWVVDLETLTPVTADVTIYQDTTPMLVEKSDENGFASFSLAGLPIGEEDGPLFTVKAQVGDTFTFAAVNYFWQTYSLSQSGEQDHLLHLTLDRPVYEVGERAYVRAVLRGLENGRPIITPPGQTMTATLKGWDADYNRIKSETITMTTGEFGVAYGEIVIPYHFLAGEYGAYLYYQDTVKSLSFEVVEPLEEDAPIVTVTTIPIVGQGQQFEVVVDVKDASGAPVFDEDVQITLLESVGGGSGCFSSNGTNEWLSTDRVNERGRTDINGRYTFSITAEMGYSSHRPFADTNMAHSISAVVATVIENGLVGTGFSVVEVANVSENLIWQPFSMIQAAGQPFVVRAAIEELSGSPVVGRSVSLRLHHVDGSGIGYYLEPGQLISSVSTSSDDEGQLTAEMTVGNPGYYELRIVSQDSFGNEMIAYRPLYVTGTGPAENVPGLKLGIGADSYLVGESGQLVVLTNEPGLAMLTLANQDGLRNEVINLSENVTVIDLPLTEADAPLLTVEVDMWLRSSSSPAVDYEYYGAAYSRRDGDLLSRSLSISVVDVNKQLQVSLIENGETNEAGQTAVTVQVLNGRGEPVAAEVALSLVSQSLYSHFPDHSRSQYGSLFVRPTFSQVVYHSLAPRRDLSYDYGGGCGCGGGWWSDTMLPGVANEQPGFWFPGLRTDFNGQVTVFLTLPDNPDGWHYSVSAITADEQVGEVGGQFTN